MNKISREDYAERTINLYVEKNNEPYTKENESRYERRELELKIDYKLGVDFPKHRREELWKVHQKLENTRMLGVIGMLLMWAFRYRADQFYYRRVIKSYSKVLSKEELNAFLGSEVE